MNSTNDKAYILIDKYHSGQATQEEVAYLQEWKQSSATNRKLYDELIMLLGLINGLKEWRQFDKSKAWAKFRSRISSKTLRIVRQLSAAAAILVFVCMATFYAFNSNTFSAGEAYVSGLEQNFSLLADGTEIFLGESAKIYTSNFSLDNRFIRTEGNYFVHIASDEASPFTLETDKISIKVLGTSFKVEESEELTSVSVREGKVLITSYDGVEYTLEGGQQFILNKNNISINKIATTDWGLFAKSYEDESIFNLFSDLSETYGNLKINAEGLNATCLITTKISNSTVLEIIKELDLLFKIDYTIQDGVIIIERVTC